MAVHSGVVALMMLASALVIDCSPYPKPSHGMTLEKTAMMTKGRILRLVPAGSGARRLAAKTRSKTALPLTVRTRTSVVCAMSCTATLMKRKEAPQIRASAASARYGKSARAVGRFRCAMAGQEVLGHGVHGRALLVFNLFLLDPVALVVVVDQLHRLVHLLDEVNAMPIAQVLEPDLDDCEGHLGEVEESLVAVHPHTQVDLGDRPQAVGLGDGQQQAELDPVAGVKGDAFQHLAPPRVLPRERLHQAGELGKEQVEQRSCGQLGESATALCLEFVAVTQRTAIEALHVMDLGVGQQRPEQAVNELRVDVRDVGVDPADEVPF